MIQKERLLNLTQHLLRIDSQNPPGREKKIADFIARDMRIPGISVRPIFCQPNRPNIIAVLRGTWPRVKAGREAILLTPHVDTVPVGSGWKYPPLGGRILNGRIYGRGASDDKGNLACAMEVMRSLAEDGVRLRRDVVMAATVDEETGSKAGIIPLLEKKVLCPRVAVVLDSDEYDVIIAQKGLIHCRVQIFGKKAHGAYNWRGINAIEQAAEIIHALRRHRFAFKKHPLLRPPTINVGTVRGGDKVNMVADFCEFSLDIRYVPGMTPTHILREVKGIIGQVTRRFKLVIDDQQYPYEMSPRHPAVMAYLAAGKKHKIGMALKGSEGATVITFFQHQGIPAFATGYGKHGMAHTTDECAETDMLYNGAKVLDSFIRDYDRTVDGD